MGQAKRQFRLCPPVKCYLLESKPLTSYYPHMSDAGDMLWSGTVINAGLSVCLSVWWVGEGTNSIVNLFVCVCVLSVCLPSSSYTTVCYLIADVIFMMGCR